MADKPGGHGGGGGEHSGWKILLGFAVLIGLGVYLYMQGNKNPPAPGEKRKPLDFFGIPSRIPVPSFSPYYRSSSTPTP